MEPLPSVYFVTAEAPIGTREKTAVKGDGRVSSKTAYERRFTGHESSFVGDRVIAKL